MGGEAVPERGASVWRSCRASGLDPDHPLHVVDDVCQADPGLGSDHADGSHDQSHAMLLAGEDVLDVRPDAPAGCVAAAGGHGHRPTTGLAVLELWDQAAAH